MLIEALSLAATNRNDVNSPIGLANTLTLDI